MTYGNAQGMKAVQQYGQVAVQSRGVDASPHRMIQMLLEGAIEKVNIAKGYMSQGNVAEKGSHISWAMSIIDGLYLSLDMEAGGEIAENLAGLYEYSKERLFEANVKNDPAALDEVATLLNQVRAGWAAIADEVE